MSRKRGTALYCYSCEKLLDGNPWRCPHCGSAAFFLGALPVRRSVQAMMPQERETNDEAAS
jgi:DNA-directed RNA polymerase subunit RPC12/RpoP